MTHALAFAAGGLVGILAGCAGMLALGAYLARDARTDPRPGRAV